MADVDVASVFQFEWPSPSARRRLDISDITICNLYISNLPSSGRTCWSSWSGWIQWPKVTTQGYPHLELSNLMQILHDPKSSLGNSNYPNSESSNKINKVAMWQSVLSQLSTWWQVLVWALAPLTLMASEHKSHFCTARKLGKKGSKRGDFKDTKVIFVEISSFHPKVALAFRCFQTSNWWSWHTHLTRIASSSFGGGFGLTYGDSYSRET